MEEKYIIALDQGTTSSRCIAFSLSAVKKAVKQKEFPQIFPKPGWVEHNPMDILSSQMEVMNEVVHEMGAENICAIGITNQRETTIVWDAETGKPVYNAIVWQDRRTADFCHTLEPYSELIREKTGLQVDPYFSGTKIRWILDNVPGARVKAEAGQLRFGTVDSWLVWNLTGGHSHITDVSNASRTMLFNINTLQWDEQLLSLLDIPSSMLPEVCSSSQVYGYTEIDGVNIPVAGVIGDQQSALFGQLCCSEGSVKNTYGTGCFLLLNTGSKVVKSSHGLLSSVAWKIGDNVNYVLEGSVFVAGAVVQWLRDGLGIIKNSSDIEALASSVPDNGGVCFVPALTGLGAPYWNAEAKGTITGITRGTTSAHIARAALEGIAFSVMDVVQAMREDTGLDITQLRVDGGASANNLLMQIQSDCLGSTIIRPCEKETTALGAAFMAGLAVGLWSSVDQLKCLCRQERVFEPSQDVSDCGARMWHAAIAKTLL